MNLFNRANYPATEPESVVIGDYWRWRRDDLSDYASSAYTLIYTLRHQTTDAEVTITATVDAGAFVVEVASTVTDDYAAGRYHWQAAITRVSDSARLQIGSGWLDALADSAEDEVDRRSHWRKVLDYTEALLQGTATKEAQSYSVDGLTLARRSIDEIQKLYYRAKAEVTREDAATAGKLAGTKVRIRFVK